MQVWEIHPSPHTSYRIPYKCGKFESLDLNQWNACEFAKFRAPMSWGTHYRVLDEDMCLHSRCNVAPATGTLVHMNKKSPNYGKPGIPWSILTKFMQVVEI